jgi:hypothetical protein
LCPVTCSLMQTDKQGKFELYYGCWMETP